MTCWWVLCIDSLSGTSTPLHAGQGSSLCYDDQEWLLILSSEYQKQTNMLVLWTSISFVTYNYNMVEHTTAARVCTSTVEWLTISNVRSPQACLFCSMIGRTPPVWKQRLLSFQSREQYVAAFLPLLHNGLANPPGLHQSFQVAILFPTTDLGEPRTCNVSSENGLDGLPLPS